MLRRYPGQDLDEILSFDPNVRVREGPLAAGGDGPRLSRPGRRSRSVDGEHHPAAEGRARPDRVGARPRGRRCSAAARRSSDRARSRTLRAARRGRPGGRSAEAGARGGRGSGPCRRAGCSRPRAGSRWRRWRSTSGWPTSTGARLEPPIYAEVDTDAARLAVIGTASARGIRRWPGTGPVCCGSAATRRCSSAWAAAGRPSREPRPRAGRGRSARDRRARRARGVRLPRGGTPRGVTTVGCRSGAAPNGPPVSSRTCPPGRRSPPRSARGPSSSRAQGRAFRQWRWTRTVCVVGRGTPSLRRVPPAPRRPRAGAEGAPAPAERALRAAAGAR